MPIRATTRPIGDAEDRRHGALDGRCDQRQSQGARADHAIVDLQLVNTNLKIFSNCNEAARYALRIAVRSDVSIYTIDPRGTVPTHGAPAEFADRSERSTAVVRGPLDAARYLAEESGGFAVVNSNSLDAGFARVMRENSAYYLIGYYSTNPLADGEFRRNKIVVSVPRARVVYRNGYLARRE